MPKFNTFQDQIDQISDENFALSALARKDPCYRLGSIIHKHIHFFEDVLRNEGLLDYAPRGRPKMDPLFMLEICFMRRQLNISYDRMAVKLETDNLVRVPLGISRKTKTPSPKTIWKYSDLFDKKGIFEKCFAKFNEFLTKTFRDFAEDTEVIGDSSFNEVNKQHNKPKENQAIKDGKGDELFLDDPRKKAQKDVDARGSKKGNVYYFGYKAHVLVARFTKFIRSLEVTPANVHDSQMIRPLLAKTPGIKELYVDSAYVGKKLYEGLDVKVNVIERAYRNKPLTEDQKKNNNDIAKIRCRVEHVFGYIEQTLNGWNSRCVVMVRARQFCFLTALLYNMARAFETMMA